MERNDDGRVVEYLRSRADVRVPDGAIERVTERTGASQARWRIVAPTPVRWLSVAAAAAAIVLVGALVVARPPVSPAATRRPPSSAIAQSSPGSSTPTPAISSIDPNATDQQGFPLHALGMRVVSAGELDHLIDAGELDGRIAAVRGYWIYSLVPSCPAPLRWYSPLEGYCQFELLSDTPYTGYTCDRASDGTGSCGTHEPPSGARTISPILVDNGVNYERVHSDPNAYPDGLPVVLIGHAGDPRYLQCPVESVVDCQKAFVVDTVAWAGGRMLDVALPDDAYAPKPAMSLEDVGGLIGSSDLVSATVTTESEAASVDPRANLVGEGLVWVVRTLRQPKQSEEIRGADVWIVADESREVIDNFPLAVDGYGAALLRVQAIARGPDSPNDRDQPFYSVDAADGSPVHQGIVGGGGIGGGGKHAQLYYPGAPLLIEPGFYSLRAWQSQQFSDSRSWGPPTDVCETSIAAVSGDNLRLEVAFPPDGPCDWRDPTFDDSPY